MTDRQQTESHQDHNKQFPWLTENQRISFPKPTRAGDSLIAYGGNLSPGVLLSAYEQGIFPWYDPGGPILWHSPDPRFVLFPDKLHISKSMHKLMKQAPFQLAVDRNFTEVIRACAKVPRPGQNGTWLDSDMQLAYLRLHHLGWAHSAEAYQAGRLVGGCYGIRLGRAFFGESMFRLVPNASKAAFFYLADILFNDDVCFIDCQVPSAHLGHLGAEILPRRRFLKLLSQALAGRFGEAADDLDRRGSWHNRYFKA